MIRRWLVGGFAAMFLVACTGLPVGADVNALLGPPLPRFAADGRISVRQGARSDHLLFDWMHAPERDVVLFSSPLGQGLAEMGRDAGGAWLKLPGQAETRAGDLAALTQQLFGAALPLEVLADWIGGSHPGTTGEVDGWRIDVTESAVFRERRLPSRIEVRRDEIELKIVITGWGDHD